MNGTAIMYLFPTENSRIYCSASYELSNALIGVPALLDPKK